MVAEAEVRAPDLLAAHEHLEPARGAVAVDVHPAVDVATALEQRVGKLDVEAPGRE
jgi:hypothetical protein